MKDRAAVITNGRAAFYACMWNDLRQAAMDCGWALGLHGSLASDMDIMAMPWTENATSAQTMINTIISRCFTGNFMAEAGTQCAKSEKPNGRVVYTVPIFADFYLDINIIEA